ncbi:MAG: FG-GAP repeat protein, partial [Anaerolineae bacterium]|nr:FG-GAP repeat protein [Anaerolineae bacterium]
MKSKLSLFRCTRDLDLLVVMALLLGNLAFVCARPGAPLASAAAPEPVTPGASADLLSGVSTDDWWAAAQENIRRSEYHVTWQEQTYLADVPAAYQSPNRAQNLRTYFADAGPIIIPRVWSEGTDALPWRWELSLVAWGRDQALQPAPQAAIRVQDDLVEYRRGELVEWYRNDEKGLEQGFTLASPPPALSQLTQEESQSLVLELAYSSDLTPELVQDGAEIEFRARDGSTVLRYGSLLVKDAAGQTLPSRLFLTSQVIHIIVDDAAALYPIRVAPTITGLPDAWNWKVEGNAANTEFGYAVSTAGDVNGDGYSDVIVGAPKYDGGQTDEGRAYVYHGSPSGLSTTAAWHTESDQTNAEFGAAVSTAGDVNGDRYADVVVGAPYWESTGSQADEGGIWVYHGAYLAGLSTTPSGHAELNQAGGCLGISVGAAGNVNGDAYADVIAGASHATNGQSAEGIVRVWHGSATGIGTNTTANWQGESNQTNAHFGNSAFTAGDVNGDSYSDVIIGAPEYDNGRIDEGAAFVWHGSANGVNNDVNGNPTNAAWITESDRASALLGVDVSMAGDVNGDGYADVIVGAPYYTNGQADEGGTWVYHGSATGLNTGAATHDEGNQAGARFGTSVGTAGDVNGDGYADVLIGAPDYTNGESAEGRVWVWHGSSSGMSASHNWRTEGNQADAHLGMSATTAGDVNGDGYSDVIIGAPGYHNPNTDEGAALVYHGSPATLSDTADWTKRSNQEGAYFGWSLGTAGDVNGDGYADIIVGAPLWDDGQANEGGAWVYRGSESGLVSAPYWYKQSDQANAQFGYSVGAAGDVNGDGYGDVIVGAVLWDAGQDNEGGAWVYHGSSTGVTSAPAWYKQSDQASAQFGYSVGTAGDVNGDGYSDIIVGTPFWNHGQTNEGGAWVYHGSETGVISAPAWYKQSDQASAQFGYSVGTAG